MNEEKIPQVPEQNTSPAEEQAPPPPPEPTAAPGGSAAAAPSPPPEPPAAPSETDTAVPPPPPPAVAGQRAKADLGKRFVAALIDGVLAGVAGIIPVVGGLVGAAYMLVRDGLELDFMDGRSLGKKVMKLRPVRLDGRPMDIGTSVKRNIPFAIGPLIMVIPILGWILGPVVAMVIGLIEAVLVLTDADGRRMGDKLAETMVIETDD